MRKLRIIECLTVWGAIWLTLTGCTLRLPAESERQRERADSADCTLVEYHAKRQDIEVPLTFESCLRMAMENNLSVRVAKRRAEIQQEMATGRTLQMLPSATLNTEISRRDQPTASKSQDFLTGRIDDDYTLSTEQSRRKLDLGFTWNLLDFGVSYLQSRQAATQIVITREDVRRIIQEMALEVATQYWRAVVAQELVRHSEPLLESVQQAQHDIDEQIQARIVSEIEGLQQKANLQAQAIRIAQYQQRARTARAELARLIGLTSDSRFDIAQADMYSGEAPLPFDLDVLERVALRRRPELLQNDLEKKVSIDEARIQLIKMFPSPSVYRSYESDANKFLYYGEWTSVGLRTAHNLLSIPRYASARKQAQLRTGLIDEQRLLLSVGILSQVHIAMMEYQEAMIDCRRRREYEQTHRNILNALEQSQREGKAHEAMLLDQRFRVVEAKAAYLIALAEAKSLRARIWNSAGLMPEDDPAKYLDIDKDGGVQEGAGKAAAEAARPAPAHHLASRPAADLRPMVGAGLVPAGLAPAPPAAGAAGAAPIAEVLIEASPPPRSDGQAQAAWGGWPANRNAMAQAYPRGQLGRAGTGEPSPERGAACQSESPHDASPLAAWGAWLRRRSLTTPPRNANLERLEEASRQSESERSRW